MEVLDANMGVGTGAKGLGPCGNCVMSYG